MIIIERVGTIKRVIKEGNPVTKESWKKIFPEEFSAAESEIRKEKIEKLLSEN